MTRDDVLTALSSSALALVAVFRMSFVVAGERWAMLADDAMISMRYARNLAAGQGFVWNAGEYVEGITNPLWALGMSLAHLLPLPERLAALPVQLAGAACLVLAVVVLRRIGGWPPAVLAMLYLPLTYWTASGLEVPAVALCAVLAVRFVQRGTVRHAYMAAAVAFLLRPDAVLIAAALFVFVRERRAYGAVLITGVALAVTLARLAYFGDVLPNTFYLKAGGFTAGRAMQGAEVFARNWLVLFALAAVGFFSRPATTYMRLAAGICVLHAAYVVVIGGDAWDWWAGGNRWIASVSPLALLLAARTAGAYRPAQRIGFALVLVMALHTRMHREFFGMKGLLHADDHRAQVELALELRDRYPDARLAVTWAGIVPYLHGGRCIDILGKCDRRIAHSAPHAGETVPGHTKWDYEYSITAQRPDIIVALWKDTAAVCRQIAGGYAYGPSGVRIRHDYAATVAARK